MGKSLIDMTNQRFGRLLVIEYTGKNINGNAVWLCKCDCGNFVEVSRNNLKCGSVKSCGCYRKEITSNLKKTHGLSNHNHIKWIYQSMKQRCYNPNNKRYKNYGGRGIKVCDEWLNNESGFTNFYEWIISQGYIENKNHRNQSLDRKDNDGNYSPDNCRIVDYITQANNTSNNIYYNYKGKVQTLAQWCREFNLDYHTIYNRITVYKWSIQKALETPIIKQEK